MDEQEAIRKLITLSQRERQVLGMVCSGLMYKDIAQTLFISLPTVKSVMGRVYVKLGLDQMDKPERAKAIYQLYCPLLKNLAQMPESMPPDDNEPVTSEIIGKVDEDELALLVIPQPEPVKIPLPRNTPQAPQPVQTTNRPRGGLVTVLIVIVCILAAVYFLKGILFKNSPASVATSEPVQSNPVVQPTEAVITEAPVVDMPTNTVPVPTNTETQLPPTETATPQPTETLMPTNTLPAISLPFTDNFNSGINSNWKVVYGNWLTSDGRCTIADADNTWEFVVLNDPQWKNYKITTDVRLENSDEGEIAVLVRYLESENKYLAFHAVNIFSKGGWALYDGNDFSEITGYGTVAIPQNFQLEIEVIGDQYIARINGSKTQEINLSGHSNGGVGLGISCFYPPCASFDNFQIAPIQ